MSDMRGEGSTIGLHHNVKDAILAYGNKKIKAALVDDNSLVFIANTAISSLSVLTTNNGDQWKKRSLWSRDMVRLTGLYKSVRSGILFEFKPSKVKTKAVDREMWSIIHMSYDVARANLSEFDKQLTELLGGTWEQVIQNALNGVLDVVVPGVETEEGHNIELKPIVREIELVADWGTW